jgi:hypothetical protein
MGRRFKSMAEVAEKALKLPHEVESSDLVLLAPPRLRRIATTIWWGAG